MNNKDEILMKVNKLVYAHRQGFLGGEKMPEDEPPYLEKGSKQNYMYFTLPMALNYQRNSYVLWEGANRMYADKVALQPNKQPAIWKKICETIEDTLDGDIRNLFLFNDYSVNLKLIFYR